MAIRLSRQGSHRLVRISTKLEIGQNSATAPPVQQLPQQAQAAAGQVAQEQHEGVLQQSGEGQVKQRDLHVEVLGNAGQQDEGNQHGDHGHLPLAMLMWQSEKSSMASSKPQTAPGSRDSFRLRFQVRR